MKQRLCLSFILALLCMSLPACQEDMESRSYISKFRILGVQTSPPEAVAGDSVEVRGIFAPVEGQAATVAFVTVDTQWIAQLGSVLPDNVAEMTDAELQDLAGALLIMQGMTDSDAAEVLVPEFKVVVAPVDETTGLAVLPAENLVISPALIAIMRLLGQTEALPLYLLACSNGTINEASLLNMVENLTDSQEIGALGTACQGSDATSLAAYKAVNIHIPDGTTADTEALNSNPRIQSFRIEKTVHAPNTLPGVTGRVLCEGEDGCRDPFQFQVSVYKDDFQFFQGYERRENEMEKMFVSWFSNGGEFGNSRIRSDDAQIASDAMKSGDSTALDEILADSERKHWFTVDWLPPVEGGIFDLWVVVNDLRGGVGYARYHISADAPNY